MLACEFARLDVPFHVGAGLCTLRATGSRLNVACERFGITLNHHHRALADARATAILTRQLSSKSRRTVRAATVGPMARRSIPRTLRRETAEAGISDLARIVSHTYYPSSDETLLQYLDALDWVLDDGVIDAEEHAAMVELADSLKISSEQRIEAHRAYMAAIIAAARRDGIVTEAEQCLIRQVANALELANVAIPEVTHVPLASDLQQGMRVCFTGQAVVGGQLIDRHLLEQHAACAGLQPVGSVTKRGCDLLIAADPSSQSDKVRMARRYGIPLMAVDDFLAQIGVDTTSK